MKKTQLLKIVNPLLALAFLWVAGTGILHELIPFTVYAKIHPLGGYVFSGLAAVHIVLNWSWIKNSLFKNKRS